MSPSDELPIFTPHLMSTAPHGYSLHPEDHGQSFLEQVRRVAQDLAEEDRTYNATDGVVFTPAPPSGLPTDERFWFKQAAGEASVPDDRYSHILQKRREEEAAQHELLRSDAQIFAERFCTESRFQRAWDVETQRESQIPLSDGKMIKAFMAEVHHMEWEELDDKDWGGVDWTKAFPRIDRIARAWALAKLQGLPTDTDHTSRGHDRVDMTDEDTALENTGYLR